MLTGTSPNNSRDQQPLSKLGFRLTKQPRSVLMRLMAMVH